MSLESICNEVQGKVNHAIEIKPYDLIDKGVYGHHAGFSHFCIDARMCDYKVIKNNHSYCVFYEREE